MLSNDWFENETHAYETNIFSDRAYEYHALNEYYGNFKKYEQKIDVLGYGSADGKELQSLAVYCNRIIIVDPTVKLKSDSINGVKVEYHMPRKDGKLKFDDGSFDLITCFGVLMYIMNPEVVINEMIRVLKVGGELLIREPSTDMHVGHRGNEARMGEYTRGLPPAFFRNVLSNRKDMNYSLKHCMFSPWVKLTGKIFSAPLNVKSVVIIDAILSRLFSWNWKYRRRTFFDKFAPGALFIKVKKNK